MIEKVTPQSVLDFWVNAGPSRWWKKNQQFDADIARLFGGTHLEAASGLLEDWRETPDTTLALVLVLDQFSRNLFRNDPRAFAQDPYCCSIVKAAMENGTDRQARDDINEFFYLPLMHSEDISDQKLCLTEMERLGKVGNIKAAKEHLDIIEKFGRFPHRNAVLGRKTSAAEQAFLDAGGFAG